MNSLVAQTRLILRNDLRLLWRDLQGGKLAVFSSLALLLVIFAALHLVSILLFYAIHTHPPLAGETVAWCFFGFLMLGAAMNHAISVLFERADFDLLLSSPVAPRAILLARLMAMTVGAALSVVLFLMPLLDGAILVISWQYAWGYLVWLLLATTVASAGVWGTLLLVRWLGPRRARTWAQVVAAGLGASLYIIFQSQNLMPREMRGRVWGSVMQVFENPALQFVARAGRGDWRALLALALLTGLFAALTTRLLSRLFVTGIQEGGSVKPKGQREGHRFRFSDGLGRATFRKDLRLIARDPLLLSKILPSAFYLVPLAFSVSRFGKIGAPGLLAPMCVLLMATLSTQLAIVATAGEEGWDLIRLSPASTVRLRIAKIAAAMALPGAAGLALAVTVAILGRPGLALMALSTALICTAACCWLEVATIRPTPRKDLMQNPRRARPFSVVRVACSLIFFIVGIVGVGLAANGLWAFATIALGVVTLTALACFTLIAPHEPEFA